MTNEELNLRISELREPKPTKPGTDYVNDVDLSPETSGMANGRLRP